MAEFPRKSVRFPAAPGTLASVDARPEAMGPVQSAPFDPKIYGLVLNESHSGCAVIMTGSPGLTVGSRFRVRVGDLPVLPAEVRWIQTIENAILKIGLQFLE